MQSKFIENGSSIPPELWSKELLLHCKEVVFKNSAGTFSISRLDQYSHLTSFVDAVKMLKCKLQECGTELSNNSYSLLPELLEKVSKTLETKDCSPEFKDQDLHNVYILVDISDSKSNIESSILRNECRIIFDYNFAIKLLRESSHFHEDVILSLFNSKPVTPQEILNSLLNTVGYKLKGLVGFFVDRRDVTEHLVNTSFEALQTKLIKIYQEIINKYIKLLNDEALKLLNIILWQLPKVGTEQMAKFIYNHDDINWHNNLLLIVNKIMLSDSKIYLDIIQGQEIRLPLVEHVAEMLYNVYSDKHDVNTKLRFIDTLMALNNSRSSLYVEKLVAREFRDMKDHLCILIGLPRRLPSDFSIDEPSPKTAYYMIRCRRLWPLSATPQVTEDSTTGKFNGWSTRHYDCVQVKIYSPA